MGGGSADRGRGLAREEVSQVSDIIDDANNTAEFFLQADLSRRKAVEIPRGVGLCFNCGAAVDGDARWCDVDCRKDWEDAQRRR